MRFEIVWLATDDRKLVEHVETVNGVLRLNRDRFGDKVAKVEIHSEKFTARTGEAGWFAIPDIEGDHLGARTRFRDREDCETVFRYFKMPVVGVNHGTSGTLAVVSGLPFEYELVVGVKNGGYYLYFRFVPDRLPPSEDVEIHFFELAGPDAELMGMAKCYRKYQLDRGACRTLRDRSKDNPMLQEIIRAVPVRVRMAWKPVPPPVDEQTPENEPPLTVALTFDQVCEIIEEFHRQGIKHAEFCLVGWNKSGHDGRFPDLFPVEEKLGGEAGLRRTIALAKKYGYLIDCHTNIIDSYSIAKRFSPDRLQIDSDGTSHLAGKWGGGQSYIQCAKAAYEELFVQDAADLAALGFSGVHYLDVLSIVCPQPCFNPKHPLTRTESARWWTKTLQLARDTFGGSGSEGSFDFCIGSIDTILYTDFFIDEKLPPICDEAIPFWQLVYHGIVLYNSFSESVNGAIKQDKSLAMRNLAYGGRSVFYYYSRFLSSGHNWMGNEDLTVHNADDLRSGVAAIKSDCDRRRDITPLLVETFEAWEARPDGTVYQRFSNQAEMIVNPTAEAKTAPDGATIKPFDFILL